MERYVEIDSDRSFDAIAVGNTGLNLNSSLPSWMQAIAQYPTPNKCAIALPDEIEGDRIWVAGDYEFRLMP